MSSHRAFSLVETLVVVAIIAVLAGIVFSVYASAKGRGVVATDLSNLRQIGQARQMYIDDHGGVEPSSLIQLLGAGLITKEISVSAADQSPRGLRQLAQDQLVPPDRQVENSARISYITMEDSGWTPGLKRLLTEGPEAGWLINLAHCRFGPTGRIGQADGTYHRLRRDGSVKTLVATTKTKVVSFIGLWGYEAP